MGKTYIAARIAGRCTFGTAAPTRSEHGSRDCGEALPVPLSPLSGLRLGRLFLEQPQVALEAAGEVFLQLGKACCCRGW